MEQPGSFGSSVGNGTPQALATPPVVSLNGATLPVQLRGVTKFTELVELVKATIDPEHMIVSILVNGAEASDEVWSGNIVQLGGATIDFLTDTPLNFVETRFALSADTINAAYLQVRDARKLFQSGDNASGNQNLLGAIRILQAFFEWYSTILELVPAPHKSTYDIDAQVKDISEVCKRLCQQQLYQSWWAMGETIEKQLEPKLDALETHCRRYRAPQTRS